MGLAEERFTDNGNTRANVQNFSIYRYEHLLFLYMEYTGENYEADMTLIAADPETQLGFTFI